MKDREESKETETGFRKWEAIFVAFTRLRSKWKIAVG